MFNSVMPSLNIRSLPFAVFMGGFPSRCQNLSSGAIRPGGLLYLLYLVIIYLMIHFCFSIQKSQLPESLPDKTGKSLVPDCIERLYIYIYIFISYLVSTPTQYWTINIKHIVQTSGIQIGYQFHLQSNILSIILSSHSVITVRYQILFMASMSAIVHT